MDFNQGWPKRYIKAKNEAKSGFYSKAVDIQKISKRETLLRYLSLSLDAEARNAVEPGFGFCKANRVSEDIFVQIMMECYGISREDCERRHVEFLAGLRVGK